MTIKEIIKITATIIGREDVVSYLDGNTETLSEDTKKTVEIMERLSNLVINELACSFIPMKNLERVNSQGKVYYKNLSKNPLEILTVYDLDGNKLAFSVASTFVKTPTQVVDVEYSFFPPEYSLDDQVGYSEKEVPSRVLAYGLASEYAITQGCFKDAVMWHKRYVDSVAEICSPKNSFVKERKWL